MGTKQHFVLFENVSGYSIFLVKEFDEIIRNFSAHVNSFLKPIAYVPFNSVADAIDNVEAVSKGRVSALLSSFLHQNLPAKDAVLGVADQILGESILALDIGFECMWDTSIRELLRIIRSNSSRLLRSLIVQPGVVGSTALPAKATSAANESAPGHKAEKRARLVVALSRARLQLDLVQHLADTGVVRSLNLLDSMDLSLGKSVKRLRTAYALHFPELCRSGDLLGVDDYCFACIVTHSPERDKLVQCREELNKWLGGDSELAESIITLAKTSTGQDISSDDVQSLQQYGQFLLNILKSRSHCCDMLERRVRSLVPNLTALMDRALPGNEEQLTSSSLQRVRRVGDRVSSVFVVARLLSHAVNLDRLAKMSSSRINSLGASKSLFRRSGAVAASAAGLLGRTVASATDENVANHEDAISSLAKSIVDMSGGRLRPIVVRRRVARLLAAKSTLACRADCYRRMNPFHHLEGVKEENGTPASTPQLDSGEYGAALGEEAKRQMRVWAEANGVQLERTLEDLEKQRENRKKYRKAKRKGWLRRKTASTGPPLPQKTPQKLPLDEGFVADMPDSGYDKMEDADELITTLPSAKRAKRKSTTTIVEDPTPKRRSLRSATRQSVGPVVEV